VTTFGVNCFLMQLFKTSNVDITNSCRLAFNLDMPSVLVANHTVKFEGKFTKLEKAFASTFNNLISNFGSLDIVGVIVIVIVCLATLILLSYCTKVR